MFRQRIKGSVAITVGYLLSPVSAWNDLFINIPLAYLFALPFGFLYEGLFLPAMILGYWITNLTGFGLMHYGFKGLFGEEAKQYTKKELRKDITVSLFYTLVVVALFLVGWLSFPAEYFQ